MAFTGNTNWQVQTTGDDTNNGGGFDCGVTGFPTDGTVDANTGNTNSPVFSSASYTFVAGDVGAWIFIKAGTNSLPGFYQIASVAGGKATLSAAIGEAYLVDTRFHPSGRNTAAGIATVGTPTGLTWGIDYSQQDAAEITFTDLVIGGTTTQFTSAGNPVGKNFIGNIISITSGTGFTVQRVAVVSTSGTTATCDKSLGTGGSTGGAGRLGGALATPGLMCSLLSVSGMQAFVAANATHVITSASNNVSGGCLNPSAAPALVIGYSTNRFCGNSDTPPTIQLSLSLAGSFMVANQNCAFYNFIFDGNNKTNSAFSGGTGTFIGCTIKGFTASGNAAVYIACLVTGNSTTAISGVAMFCEAYGNTATPMSVTRGANLLSYANTGASTDGVQATGALTNVTCVGNGQHGIGHAGSGGAVTFVNIICQGNGGAGFNAGGSILVNYASYNNTSGRFATPTSVRADINPIQYTADAFVDTANNNYSLNNLANGGAALRAAGLAGLRSTFPRGLTSSYLDIGAAQHADQGGSNVIVTRKPVKAEAPIRRSRSQTVVLPATDKPIILPGKTRRTQARRSKAIKVVIPPRATVPLPAFTQRKRRTKSSKRKTSRTMRSQLLLTAGETPVIESAFTASASIVARVGYSCTLKMIT